MIQNSLLALQLMCVVKMLNPKNIYFAELKKKTNRPTNVLRLAYVMLNVLRKTPVCRKYNPQEFQTLVHLIPILRKLCVRTPTRSRLGFTAQATVVWMLKIISQKWKHPL